MENRKNLKKKLRHRESMLFGAISGLFLFIFGLYKQTLHFLQQYTVKNVHPESGDGIWTHGLLNASLLPKPQDQGSRVVAFSSDYLDGCDFRFEPN